MKTLEELLAGVDYGDAVALRAPGRGEQVYTYERFQECVYELSTVFADHDIEDGSRIALASDHSASAVFAFYATAVIGGATWIGAPRKIKAHAAVAPTEQVTGYTLPEGALRVGYGSKPDDDSVVHFERAIWKADGRPPDAGVLPGTKVITDGEWQYSHRNLLKAGMEVADRLDENTTVTVRAPLSDPRTVAAALVAPLLVGGTVRFPADADPAGDVAVTDDTAPEPRAIPVQSVPLG